MGGIQPILRTNPPQVVVAVASPSLGHPILYRSLCCALVRIIRKRGSVSDFLGYAIKALERLRSVRFNMQT